MDSQTRKYKQAAVAYLAYGLTYLLGAVYLAQIGVSERTSEPSGFWWFAIGALMVIIFPILIWRQFKWVTRALAILVGFRIIGLVRMLTDGADTTIPIPPGIEMPMVYGTIAFLLVAVATAYMLARAGWRWDRLRRPTTRVGS